MDLIQTFLKKLRKLLTDIIQTFLKELMKQCMNKIKLSISRYFISKWKPYTVRVDEIDLPEDVLNRSVYDILRNPPKLNSDNDSNRKRED